MRPVVHEATEANGGDPAEQQGWNSSIERRVAVLEAAMEEHKDEHQEIKGLIEANTKLTQQIADETRVIRNVQAEFRETAQSFNQIFAFFGKLFGWIGTFFGVAGRVAKVLFKALVLSALVVYLASYLFSRQIEIPAWVFKLIDYVIK